MSGLGNKQTKGSNCNEILPNADGSINVNDSLLSSGIDTIIIIPATTIVLLKVGASQLVKRQGIVMEALDKGIKWGFTITTQSFDVFKNQIFILPFGGITIFLNNTSATSGSIAIGEVI